MFQHTAARRRLAEKNTAKMEIFVVSTHSRPKAAGHPRHDDPFRRAGFNTQPPEGGWRAAQRQRNALACFNTQPPEGGWGNSK